MKPIQQTLRSLGRQNADFQQRTNELHQQVLAHPDVRAFIEEHRLTQKQIDRNMMTFYEYATQETNCEHCRDAAHCKNVVKGYIPHLAFIPPRVEIRYDKCPQAKRELQERELRSLVQSISIPNDILQASMADLNELDEATKRRAVHFAVDFVDSYNPTSPPAGLYIHGPFGTGKTYLLGAIANEMKRRHQVGSLLVYVPEFVRQCKQSLRDDSLNQKVKALQEADVLMLDDLGAESMSSWIRDDVLAPILQYRLMHKRPLFISSNFSYSELKHHFLILSAVSMKN
ncbi:primosomal protein DnaI [Bacillaceae bacterium SIJ1]|uniref:primosomal protein DnaI n=1 Tax=Litoribacterium kuwaitense TaxID=1398745 RepID=UPI0013EC5CA1|nr:primosomal protein DnaI [Litoribacterium kuwaitense]NGP45012.1 primosomal protein DnaI [Litoribacterium kuwaitense]